MRMNHETIPEYLKTHGLKPSYQRIKIFEYLEKKRNHPTVDKIYQALLKNIPTFSRTTVYNTLNLFVEKKIAQVITIEENENRYDADTSIHGHFKCVKCKKVYDLEINFSDLDLSGLDQFQIDEHHFYFKGRCFNCRKGLHLKNLSMTQKNSAG